MSNLKIKQHERRNKKNVGKAPAGNAEAQYLTGLYYEDKGNTDEAFLWYEQSAA